jgi:hypothetical protein
MESRDLEPWQLSRVRDSLGQHLRTLHGVASAIERRVPATPVAKAATDAYGALRDLWALFVVLLWRLQAGADRQDDRRILGLGQLGIVV